MPRLARGAGGGRGPAFVVDNGSEDGTREFLVEEGVLISPCPATSASLRRSTSASPAPRRRWSGPERGHGAGARLPSAGSPAALEADPALGWSPAADPAAAARAAADPGDPAPVVYSAGQSLTPDGGRERTVPVEALRYDARGERGLWRLRRRLPVAPELFDAARWLRRELLRLLRGRRPQRPGADRRLAFRLRPEAVVWHVGNAPGGRASNARAPRTRAWSHATGSPPGQVHADPVDSPDRRGRNRLAGPGARPRAAAGGPVRAAGGVAAPAGAGP